MTTPPMKPRNGLCRPNRAAAPKPEMVRCRPAL